MSPGMVPPVIKCEKISLECYYVKAFFFVQVFDEPRFCFECGRISMVLLSHHDYLRVANGISECREICVVCNIRVNNVRIGSYIFRDYVLRLSEGYNKE